MDDASKDKIQKERTPPSRVNGKIEEKIAIKEIKETSRETIILKDSHNPLVSDTGERSKEVPERQHRLIIEGVKIAMGAGGGI